MLQINGLDQLPAPVRATIVAPSTTATSTFPTFPTFPTTFPTTTPGVGVGTPWYMTPFGIVALLIGAFAAYKLLLAPKKKSASAE